MQYGSGKPVLGRKFCKTCGRWRHLVDFYVDRRIGRVIVRFSSNCKTCMRVRQRELYANPVHRERKRRSDREWHTIQRRIAGAVPRDTPPAKDTKAEAVDAGPFLDWLERWKADNEHVMSVEELARRAGTDASRIREMRRNDKPRVSLGLVDRVLVAAGGDTMLWEIYPDA